MVCSLTLFFFATSATEVRSASRKIATICSSVNRLFLTGSSLTKSYLSRNHWSEETGQVRARNCPIQVALNHASLRGAAPYPVVTSLYLIEDHLMVREGLRAMLETERNQVVGESSDPARAIADLLLLQPDVVLLDLALGGRSGMEILAEVKRRALRSRCIVLTMSSNVRDVAQALRLGAWGYVLKTAPILEVTKAIESVVQGRRYLGSSVSELAAEALLHQVPEAQLLDALSARERQIVLLVVQGHSSSEIGALLHLSAKTVDTYRSRLMSKLGVRDVPALVRLAIRMGMIGADR
jgi:DNA-binding NarL/FixJ family response regulator